MYTQKLTDSEIFRFQSENKSCMKKGVAYVTLKKSATKMLKHLQYLQPVPLVRVTYHNSEFLPQWLNDEPVGIRGKVFLYSHCPHQVHVAAQQRSVFHTLVSLAHEYYHCVQFNAGETKTRNLWDLESEADSFAYDTVVQYLKKGPQKCLNQN